MNISSDYLKKVFFVLLFVCENLKKGKRIESTHHSRFYPLRALEINQVPNIIMITVYWKKSKGFSQKNYDEIIINLDFHKITCPCGQTGQFIKHGKYIRFIKTPEGLIPLEIKRLKCQACLKTHALLPEFIVPYSKILLNDQLSIIKSNEKKISYESVMLSNPLIDVDNISYVIKQYLSHWKEKLFSFGINLNQKITQSCFSFFKKQFMQIKRGSNILFLQTT